jgi:large subunit ribosomal protein L2
MVVKFYNPVTSSMRGLCLVDKSELWRGPPLKSLSYGKSSTGGRNNHGSITMRGRGAGHKRKFRVVTMDVSKFTGTSAIVERIEYDPNRSAFIALLNFDKFNAYVLSSSKTVVGDELFFGSNAEIKDGNSLPLSSIPVGMLVYGVEINPGAGAKIARAAGCYAQVVASYGNKVLLRLKSGVNCSVDGRCYATIGVASNLDNKNVKLAKAGRSRWLGRRPHVRGVAMNAIDHPHGGGRGKTSTAGPPVSPWGIKAKGFKTRNKKKKGSLSRVI